MCLVLSRQREHTRLIPLLFFFFFIQLLLEYDDQSWDQREWTNIHQTGVFHVFLIEHDLWWANQQQHQLWPALVRLSSFSVLLYYRKCSLQRVKLAGRSFSD